MLDAALQCLAAALPAESLGESGEATYLPVSMESIRLTGDVGRRVHSRAELVEHGPDGIVGRVVLSDAAGQPVAEISGIYLQRVQRRTVPLPLAQKVFDARWIPSPSEAGAAADGSWLVLTDGSRGRGAGRGVRRPLRLGRPDGWSRAYLADESAVLDAFATAAGDPHLPPVGIVVAHRVRNPERRAAPAIRPVAAATSPGRCRPRCAPSSVAGTARRRGCGWCRNRGLSVTEGEAGEPAVQRPQGTGAGAGLRAPGPAHHARRPRLATATSSRP